MSDDLPMSEALLLLIVGRLRSATLTQMQALAKRLPTGVLKAIVVAANGELQARNE